MRKPKIPGSVTALLSSLILAAGIASAAETTSQADAAAAIEAAQAAVADAQSATDAMINAGGVDERDARRAQRRVRDAARALAKANAKLEAGDYADAVQAAEKSQAELARN